ncbi:epimerase family protein Mb2239 [Arthrobacter sp. Hiyo4]|nr:epimerase family protein Mb2239 [Arthrobacter sp. Hiyo4]
MRAVVRWIMHIVIAGASGLIGTHLSATLREAGHDVTALVRREPTSASEIRWDPQRAAWIRRRWPVPTP